MAEDTVGDDEAVSRCRRRFGWDDAAERHRGYKMLLHPVLKGTKIYAYMALRITIEVTYDRRQTPPVRSSGKARNATCSKFSPQASAPGAFCETISESGFFREN